MTTINEQLTATFEGVQLEKALALTNTLELGAEESAEITVSDWNESLFTVGSKEYLVLNENEREYAVTEEIKDRLWAFRSSFLAQETDWDLLPVYEIMAQSNMCESANDAILALVEKFSSLEDFVESAVDVDGYGHFLSGYDGEEIESDCGNFYIFRQN